MLAHLIKKQSERQALNKKEHKNGGCSPDSPGEEADATDYTLTPRTEAKYQKIEEDFQIMMHRNQHINGAPQSRVRRLFIFPKIQTTDNSRLLNLTLTTVQSK